MDLRDLLNDVFQEIHPENALLRAGGQALHELNATSTEPFQINMFVLFLFEEVTTSYDHDPDQEIVRIPSTATHSIQTTYVPESTTSPPYCRVRQLNSSARSIFQKDTKLHRQNDLRSDILF